MTMGKQKQKKLYQGLALAVGFAAVLFVFFLPVFGGKNGLEYLDALYNSISKGSAYYVPALRKEAAHFEGQELAVRLSFHDERQAAESALLFARSGAGVQQEGAVIQVRGDLGRVLANCLEDTDAMYANRGQKVREKYGYEERRVLFNWWLALKEMQKDLARQERFDLVNLVSPVMKKGVECAYNYYGIEAEKIGAKAVIVAFSLVFYVVYTIWYGFAVLLLFEGWGLEF